MSERDQELDEMLDELRGSSPSELEWKRWHRAVAQFDSKSFGTRSKWAYAAAVCFGDLMGSLLSRAWFYPPPASKSPCSETLMADNGVGNATYESVYIKLGE